MNKRLCKHARHIGILLFIAVIFANKGRITDNETGIGANTLLIGLQGISIDDIGRLFQWYAGKVSTKFATNRLDHLVVGQP